MWQQFFLGFLGVSSGIIISGGIMGLLIGLSVISRYAGITHTAKHILFYEDSMLFGILFGNYLGLFSSAIPGGLVFLSFYGFFSGLFLGGWILSLEEIADVIPIFARRIHLLQGLPVIILSIAAGKTTGALLYHALGW